MKCTDCHNYQKCVKEVDLRKKRPYCPLAKEEKIITNFDRIKAMSVEEMAEFLEEACDSPCVTICDNYDWCKRNNAIEPICKNHFKQWLESEVKSNDNE